MGIKGFNVLVYKALVFSWEREVESVLGRFRVLEIGLVRLYFF